VPRSGSARRTASPISRLLALPPEEWFQILDALLVRDRELDNLATDRHAQNRDAEKAPITLVERHRHRMFRELLKRLRDWNCSEFAQLLMGQQPPPYDPPPEVETRALCAVIDWVDRFWSYPRYTSSEEQQQLKELRDCLYRAAKARLRQLQRVQAGRSDKRLRDRKTVARDAWIYRQSLSSTRTYKEIMAELKRIAPEKGWRPIRSIQGIRNRAINYANTKGKPPPPRRQNF
jgi:hypothetical protein